MNESIQDIIQQMEARMSQRFEVVLSGQILNLERRLDLLDDRLDRLDHRMETLKENASLLRSSLKMAQLTQQSTAIPG
ncbi:MAG: hypothetical protein ACRERU_23970 [Methylococcales bacterium]